MAREPSSLLLWLVNLDEQEVREQQVFRSLQVYLGAYAGKDFTFLFVGHKRVLGFLLPLASPHYMGNKSLPSRASQFSSPTRARQNSPQVLTLEASRKLSKHRAQLHILVERGNTVLGRGTKQPLSSPLLAMLALLD